MFLKDKTRVVLNIRVIMATNLKSNQKGARLRP